MSNDDNGSRLILIGIRKNNKPLKKDLGMKKRGGG